MIATRILAVVAALLLVGAFTLATVLPSDLSLAEVLAMLDQTLFDRAQSLAHGDLPVWIWTYVMTPLLLRPAWLLPASLGVLFAGAAATLASSRAASRSHHRRS